MKDEKQVTNDEGQMTKGGLAILRRNSGSAQGGGEGRRMAGEGGSRKSGESKKSGGKEPRNTPNTRKAAAGHRRQRRGAAGQFSRVHPRYRADPRFILPHSSDANDPRFRARLCVFRVFRGRSSRAATTRSGLGGVEGQQSQEVLEILLARVAGSQPRAWELTRPEAPPRLPLLRRPR